MYLSVAQIHAHVFKDTIHILIHTHSKILPRLISDASHKNNGIWYKHCKHVHLIPSDADSEYRNSEKILIVLCRIGSAEMEGLRQVMNVLRIMHKWPTMTRAQFQAHESSHYITDGNNECLKDRFKGSTRMIVNPAPRFMMSLTAWLLCKSMNVSWGVFVPHPPAPMSWIFVFAHVRSHIQLICLSSDDLQAHTWGYKTDLVHCPQPQALLDGTVNVRIKQPQLFGKTCKKQGFIWKSIRFLKWRREDKTIGYLQALYFASWRLGLHKGLETTNGGVRHLAFQGGLCTLDHRHLHTMCL